MHNRKSGRSTEPRQQRMPGSFQTSGRWVHREIIGRLLLSPKRAAAMVEPLLLTAKGQ